jgi:MSHA biogenesis protein MshK
MKRLFHFRLLLVVLFACAYPISAAILKDPTKPPSGFASGKKNAVNTQLSGYVVQSIISKSNTMRAIISGKYYQEGDTIGDYVVSEINKRDVVIENGRERKTLELYSYEIKK